jgi:hypothetical protein
MRAIPAGIEIRWRTTGKNRAMSTVHAPWRAKNCSVFSMSAGFKKTYLPQRRSSGLPPTAPIQYDRSEPVMAPAELTARIPGSENWPWLAR